MYKVKHNLTSELIIKNSRFITLVFPIDSVDEVKTYLQNAKLLYPKATHYTYAYRTFDEEKASDDGEPGGTAGMPILNVIKKQDVINVLVIVIRYFGGIKLGASGLVRAYSKACVEAFAQGTLLMLIPAKKVKIITDYSRIKELDYLLRKEVILEKSFTETIRYTTLLQNEHILDGHFSYDVIGEDYIEKEQ